MWIEGGGREGRKKGLKKKRKGNGVWTEEGRKRFEKYFGQREEVEGELEEGWRKLKKRVGEVVRKVEKELKREEKKGWWDEECKEKKGKVREELRRWKKQGRREGNIKR